MSDSAYIRFHRPAIDSAKPRPTMVTVATKGEHG
jgi:hypothetical protein